MKSEEKQFRWYYLAIFLMVVMNRIFPHPHNLTLVASVGILSGILYTRKVAAIITLAALLVSDLILHFTQDISVFGYWTVFVYTGFLSLIFLYPTLKTKRFSSILVRVPIASLFYYVWMNLAVFFYSGIYPLSLDGFMDCYIVSLPFLGYAFLGDLLGTSLLYFLFAENSFYIKRLFRKLF